MNQVIRLPERQDVKIEDTWNLDSLFVDESSWEESFSQFEQQLEGYQQYQGKLADSAETLAACLQFDSQLERHGERLGIYAFLLTTQNQADSHFQGMQARFQNLVTRAGQAGSFIRPEIMTLDSARMDEFLQAEVLEPFRLALERMIRYRPHTLGHGEEKLLAMQGEMAQTAAKAFRQLHDADLKFGLVENEQGEQVELSNTTFSQFLISPQRAVRKTAFHQYYEQFANHENTFAATLSGSILKDVYYAQARGYDSALTAALFPDNMPQTVYDSLIASVRSNLPALHRYYEVRRRKMKLDDIHQYDTYVPILSDLATDRSWDQAVEMVIESLQPLGSDYSGALQEGLLGRWCDRYPNQGKQSGAFSCGSFDGDPYILMNYQPEVLNDVFTLTHEAGHSMHSYLSSSQQPFEYYDYTIFVAEVASTFNEQLLTAHMMEQAENDEYRAYLINRELDAIRGTILRQTMFAEFEKTTHEMAQAGQPLTVQDFKDVYFQLLKDYFGPDFSLDDELALECFRIPHFYRAFYVYKYATGLSAAIALSQRVLNGGADELAEYLSFLKGGCSEDPLDLLRNAGVDMEQPQAVDTALAHFGQLVDQLDDLL
ncbi:MAG: oligoendopeptidase F [Pirellulaceae bacterium]